MKLVPVYAERGRFRAGHAKRAEGPPLRRSRAACVPRGQARVEPGNRQRAAAGVRKRARRHAARHDPDHLRTAADHRREVRDRRTQGGRRDVRTVGKVTFDETRIAHVHTRIEGWIETGVRRLHRRDREEGPADADDLQPGDAGVPAGAAARRSRAGLMRNNPLAIRRRARRVAVRGGAAAPGAVGPRATRRSNRCSTTGQAHPHVTVVLAGRAAS